MKIGEKVSWESQSNGKWSTKTGEIVGVVKAGAMPSKNYQAVSKRPKNYQYKGRDNKSYIVKVGEKLYWPRETSLKSV